MLSGGTQRRRRALSRCDSEETKILNILFPPCGSEPTTILFTVTDCKQWPQII